MPRIPGSQSRALMQEKEKLAIELHERGLTFRQISVQLNCSKQFVRRVIAQHQSRRGEATEGAEPATWNGVERRRSRERRSGKDRRSMTRDPWDRRSGLDRRGHPFYQPPTRQP
jgi:IS30 family transposase